MAGKVKGKINSIENHSLLRRPEPGVRLRRQQSGLGQCVMETLGCLGVSLDIHHHAHLPHLLMPQQEPPPLIFYLLTLELKSSQHSQAGAEREPEEEPVKCRGVLLNAPLLRPLGA